VFLLLLVSFVWAFSFGLIKGRLAGLDPTAVAVVRLAFSALVFLPFLCLRKINRRTVFKLTLVGAVQFGAMYVLYLRAFAYLHAYEVALFAITTPLYLALIESAAQHRWDARLAGAALLAIAGAAAASWQTITTTQIVIGFLLMQGSNLCFAFGQFGYRRIRAQTSGSSDLQLFGLLYLGALVVTAITSLLSGGWATFHPNPSQWFVLAYLGVIASGLCFFWWNLGATRVNAATLAVFNNAKVPLGVACSLLFFGETAYLPGLLLGGTLLIAALVEARPRNTALKKP
jgi:drug/metabolite transporter (DMT)-like permease